MIKRFTKLAKNTAREVKWWSYAAWTLPTVALACLAVINLVGTETFYANFLLIVVGTFIAVSVFWWWWAIYKFKEIFEVFERTADQLTEVKDHIIETKKIIQEDVNDVDDR